MNLLRQVMASTSDTVRDADAQRWWASAGQRSTAGVYISPDAALRISAVFACVRVIAEDIAARPLITYRRQSDGGRERNPDHPLYDVLHDAPNPWQSSFEWVFFMTACAALLGNGYSRIYPGPRGFVDTLVPLRPSRVEPKFDGQRVTFAYTHPDGRREVLLADEVFHLPGVTLDDEGIFGVSIVKWARETLGLASATESHGARVFSQGATLGGVLEHPKTLSDGAAKRIRGEFEEIHMGLDRAHRWAVLEEGMKATPLTMSNEDAEFLATREFQIAEICRWFRMQPHKIAHLVNATFSNIEHQGIEHVQDTIQPWAVRWERAIKRQLILDKKRVFSEFLLDDLLRGDTLSRTQARTAAVGGPWMTVNEARQGENLNRVEGGDDLIRPLNVTTAVTPATNGRAEADYGTE